MEVLPSGSYLSGFPPNQYASTNVIPIILYTLKESFENTFVEGVLNAPGSAGWNMPRCIYAHASKACNACG